MTRKKTLYITVIILSISMHLVMGQTKNSQMEKDKKTLSTLNKLFIANFLNQDVKAHNEIIHKDFVCIASSGAIVDRDQYMKDWATDYETSGYTSFDYADEFIRVFGNMALVRSRTVYTKEVNGKIVSGSTLYTDTYIKENDRWWCVQAQLTAVRQ